MAVVSDAIMLVDAPLDENIGTLISALESDFKYLLQTGKVPDIILAMMSELGYHSSDMFANVADTSADMRAFIKDDLTIDPIAGPAQRRVTAALLSCWDAAKKRSSKRHEEEAVQRTSQLPRTISHNVHMELVKALETMLGDLREERIPSPSMVEALLEQFEDNELRAEPFDHVVTRKEWERDGHNDLSLTSDGRLRMSRVKTKGSIHAGTESLRAAFRVIDHARLMARLQCPSKGFLLGYSSVIWAEYVEFLLGDDVHNCTAENEYGAVIARPSWGTLLRYDLECRKSAFKRMSRLGVSLQEALKEATTDPLIRYKYLITPAMLTATMHPGGGSGAGKRQRSKTPPKRQAQDKAQGKGKGR
jgi:hypothetical protein